ncbi:glycosyltransferase [Clostridium oryzae]|uniref:Cellulose synthase catalytic subunit n=1 Tax=Clostridium oryzae TaxID=1450648 RepID=A0A1V4I849_9CLOT|nr:glycosyltransferase [Clostridium oryzae]OPJ56113.1 cellulose synthase catalytic subunit [Clostridium oryzae]
MKQKALYLFTFIASIVYIMWRAFFTLPFDENIFAIVCGILLLLAELIGYLEALNLFRGRGSLIEPEKPIIPDEMFPHVDVLIATYNEGTDLLRKTINGCNNMDYPDKTKIHIYICDDTNRVEVKQLADEMHIGYITREEHVDAKAGNFNNALKNTNSPFIATFDADMIPMHDFLTEIVPYFFLPDMEKDRNGKWVKREKRDDNLKIGFIQCPQSFYNLDLFQYNLYSEKRVPNEQDFFFRYVQLIRNKSNSAIYAGSNTILAREALDKIGGFYTKVITEDLATGLSIENEGYRCYAISSVHANGLAPTDIKSLFKQRERWARGCIQTFRKLKIFRMKGLNMDQKFSYLMSVLYWYTPIRRFIFIMAPILFSLFNVVVIKATLLQMLVFWLPQVLLYNKTLSSLSGKIRTSRLSNIYDTILFPNLMPSVILESLGYEKKKFSVTKKVRENLSNFDEIKMIIPHLVLSVLSVLSIWNCLYYTIKYETGAYSIILMWLFINLYNLAMAVFFVLGRKVKRQTERINAQLPLTIYYDKRKFSAVSSDISEGGLSIKLTYPVYIPEDQELIIQVSSEDGRYRCRLKSKVVHVSQFKEQWHYAFQFTDNSVKEQLQLFSILYDRVPMLPTKVSDGSSFYEDIVSNLYSRMKNDIQLSSRRLPRIQLDIELETLEEFKIKIVNFNYDFVLIENSLDKFRNLNIIIDKEQNLYIRCELVEDAAVRLQKGSQKQLYKVLNTKQLVENERFMQMLSLWIDDYSIKQKEREEYSMSMKKDASKDEFTDIDYIKDEAIRESIMQRKGENV